MVPPSRRQFLAGLGTLATTGVTGCLDVLPRFPKRVYNQDAVTTPRTPGWRSKHGGTERRSIATGRLPADATATPVLTVDDWWEGQPVFAPNQLIIPAQLPPEGDSYEPSFEGLLALNPRTGREQWRFAYEKPFATPTVVGNTIFVQGDTTYALNRSDGSVYWEYRSGYGYSGTAPVVANDIVAIIAARSRTVVGMDAQTGEQLWSTPLVHNFPTGIASDDQGIYACTPSDDENPGELVRLDPTTGEYEWRTGLQGRVATPVVGSDRVYFWVDFQLRAFDKATGEQAWATTLRGSRHEYPNVAVDNGQCITLTQNPGRYPRVVALDASSGDQQWQGPHTHTVDYDPLSVTEAHIYVPVGESHELGLLDRTDGSIVETWTLPGHPVTGVTIDDGSGVLVTRAETAPSITVLN
ncbi:PQQ-binding-like beta-propeller repeat protein [Haloprofundus marisrubri]|uniref:PQQ-binding-like beta-propeller repeat protein n=1 Tax=Haloprofundus marisrubri TaxID=1514971 RepID=UPI0009E33617|nr:PQQ-binding-like beta-propeller repeat protein [Haloprofundus marisrubri]